MKIIFATQNENKVKEVQSLLPKDIQVLSLQDINCNEDIPETATTLEGNAALKARYIAEKFNVNCFADDTGLEIDALNGEPGVYSARYAGENKNHNDNMNLVLKKLHGKSNRKAQFRTAICLIIEEKKHVFEGVVKGEIMEDKFGQKGFGYDPIFRPNGYDETFSEMELKQKNEISHRGIAVKKLVEFLN